MGVLARGLEQLSVQTAFADSVSWPGTSEVSHTFTDDDISASAYVWDGAEEGHVYVCMCVCVCGWGFGVEFKGGIYYFNA